MNNVVTLNLDELIEEAWTQSAHHSEAKATYQEIIKSATAFKKALKRLDELKAVEANAENK